MRNVRADGTVVNLPGRIAMLGRVFDRWTVEDFSHRDVDGRLFWKCRCVCGTRKPVSTAQLTSGHSRSCGCRKGDYGRSIWTTHGQTGSPTYIVWLSMQARCSNPKHDKYPRYGGRGIRVCDRWTGEHGFENFLADMGERPEGKEIDRYPNNEGNYEPGNCRWATRSEQCRNRNTTRWVVFHGERLPLAAVSERTGIKSNSLLNRLNRGLTIEEAVALGSPGRGHGKLRGWSPAT